MVQLHAQEIQLTQEVVQVKHSAIYHEQHSNKFFDVKSKACGQHGILGALA